jgi:spore germination protein YaaH
MRLTVDLAQERGVKVLALFHNLLYGGEADGREVARLTLGRPENRARLVEEVERLLDNYGFDGVNVDIEAFYEGDGELLELFLEELAARLQPRGSLLTVSVPAKTNDRGNAWSGPFDYRRIGQIADRVAIMTYDEHGFSSGPGPIASIGWVEDVVRYAVSRIPRDKVLVGIPAYGFDWTEGRKYPRYLSYRLAMDRAERAGVAVDWDEKAKVPRYEYRDERGRHEVWFEDARSWQAKIDLVNKYELAGIAIWRLGMEDPAAWEAIRKTTSLADHPGPPRFVRR